MPSLDPSRLALDAITMREFLRSEAHDCWRRHLDAVMDDYRVKLAHASSDPLDQLRYFQGVLAGLDLASRVPGDIVKLARTT